jgi:hypothetical protein
MRNGRKKLRKICGAKNRKGLPCQCKLLLRGGKCKFHGGMSTGPRTKAGKKKSIEALRAGWAKWRTKVIKKASSP